MKKTMACLVLYCATLAHAGWFDSFSDEVPPGIKVERVAGGDDQWNATMFFTNNSFGRDGKTLVNREDGVYFDGKKVSDGKVGPQGATVCQKDNQLFYMGVGNIFQVDLDGKKPPAAIWKTQYRPAEVPGQKYSISFSPLSITNDCRKLVISIAYFPADVGKRADTFHGGYDERFRTGKTDVFLGEFTNEAWKFKRILAADAWLSHPQLEPVNGDKMIIYRDGPLPMAREACDVMNLDGSDLVHATTVPETVSTHLCRWIGDGKHLILKYRNGSGSSSESGYSLVDAYTQKTVGSVKLPFSYNVVTHTIAPKMLKNGNVGLVGDSFDGKIIFGEFDFKAEKLIRWSKIASYGKRRPSNNHLLPSDEGWFPQTNISQDGKYVAYTSQNGIGEKGSDVYVISGLPE